MLLTLLKGKLHQARVTHCDMHYEGSISIDKDLLEASGIIPFEKVAVWNVTNGARIETYAIEAPRGSKTIGLNGSAARHFEIGDVTIIAAFVQMKPKAAKAYTPHVVLLDANNEIKGQP